MFLWLDCIARLICWKLIFCYVNDILYIIIIFFFSGANISYLLSEFIYSLNLLYNTMSYLKILLQISSNSRSTFSRYSLARPAFSSFPLLISFCSTEETIPGEIFSLNGVEKFNDYNLCKLFVFYINFFLNINNYINLYSKKLFGIRRHSCRRQITSFVPRQIIRPCCMWRPGM